MALYGDDRSIIRIHGNYIVVGGSDSPDNTYTGTILDNLCKVFRPDMAYTKIHMSIGIDEIIVEDDVSVRGQISRNFSGLSRISVHMDGLDSEMGVLRFGGIVLEERRG